MCIQAAICLVVLLDILAWAEKLFLKEDDTAVGIFIFVEVCGYESRQLPIVSMILLAVVLGVVLLVASYHVFRTVRQQWGIITALRQLPCDPEYHWLWGHTPKVSFLNLILICCTYYPTYNHFALLLE